jgi:hypothetical protein
MANTVALLGTATVSGTSTYSVTFNNISQGYTDLKIVMSQKTNRDTVFQGQVIYFNDSFVGSTTVLQANGSATVTSNTVAATVIQNAQGNDSTTANIYGMIELYIGGYSQSGIYKSAYAQSVAEANATTVYNTINYLDPQILDPITSIKIESGNTSFALLAGSEYYLYGIFNQDVSAVPSAPTIGTASIGNLSASVTFTPVSNAASYTMTSSPGNISATSTTSPIRVGGLTAGTAYTFTVKANNPFGSSAASAASNSVTPTTAGVTWTNRNSVMPAASGWNGVLYSNGVFIAGIYDVANRVATSYDGITWTSRNLLTTGTGYYTGQAYGLGLWLVSSRAGAGTGYGIQYSSDNGVNWSYPSGSVANLDMFAIGFNGSAFCVVGNATTSGQYSTTGTSGWTVSTMPSNQGWKKPVGGNNNFVAIQDGGAGPTNAAATSSNNGATWTARTMTGTAQRWSDGIYEPVSGKWVFVARTGVACYSTDNGASYTASTLPTGVYNFITYGGGFYIVAGWANICTSPDGITWTLRTGPSATSGGGEGIAYGPNGAVVVQYGSINAGTAF